MAVKKVPSIKEVARLLIGIRRLDPEKYRSYCLMIRQEVQALRKSSPNK